jgi:hypothetical protein
MPNLFFLRMFSDYHLHKSYLMKKVKKKIILDKFNNNSVFNNKHTLSPMEQHTLKM